MDEASGWRVAYGCVYPAPERSGAFWLLISNCSYVLPANRQEKRRGWDSNPRDGSTPPTRFPVALLRPTRTPLRTPRVYQMARLPLPAVVLGEGTDDGLRGVGGSLELIAVAPVRQPRGGPDQVGVILVAGFYAVGEVREGGRRSLPSGEAGRAAGRDEERGDSLVSGVPRRIPSQGIGEVRDDRGVLVSPLRGLDGWPLLEADVPHEQRRRKGASDGEEHEDEAVVDGVREGLASGPYHLRDQLLPAGEGGGRSDEGLPRLLAHQSLGVLERRDEPPWRLRRGVIRQALGVTLGDDGADYGRPHRRAYRAYELRRRGRHAEKMAVHRALHGEGGGRHDPA